jgi:hypothetical protein
MLAIFVLLSLGWKIAFLYSIVVYIFLVLTNVIIKKIMGSLFKKHFSFDEDKIFFEYLDQDYITQYYASVNREPFLGRKKWLETE